jgi:uncharacterized protein YwgA
MNKGKLLACLATLGIKPTMESFDDRKKMQKISYWLPIFGIDIGLNTDSYNWYLHGPYNPQLTKALFEIVEKPNATSLEPLRKEEKTQIKSLRSFLGEDIQSTDSLELLVSLHYLLQEAKRRGIPKAIAVEVLKEKKPYFREKEIKSALKKLSTLSERS